jgi:GNAT superfamily N-acetyltransferase
VNHRVARSGTGDVRSPARLAFRELDASPACLAELARFYRGLYVGEFPDADERESQANMKRYLALKAAGWYGLNNYHILLADLDGRTVGGCVFDYLAEPNAGVLEFLFIGAGHRGGGFGAQLLAAVTRVLEADAARRGAPLTAIVAEMNDPFQPGATPDNLDPFDRCEVWGKWGFARLAFPYVQPALSRTQKPVTGLALIARPLQPPEAKAVEGAWVASVVREYMRWAMRIVAPEDKAEYRRMAAYLDQHSRVPLVPLRAYVGREPHLAYRIEPVMPRDPRIAAMVALARRAIPQPGRVVGERAFRSALARKPDRACRYHLWALRADDAPLAGMASFFTLRPGGFGGYVALDRPLRGRGLLRGLVARIEERMIRDATGARGWFIECGAEAACTFARLGFHELAVDYRPPAAGRRAGHAAPERLHLLFKPFGPVYEPPRLAPRFVLDAIAAILAHVYGENAPRAHACYLRARATLRRADGWVEVSATPRSVDEGERIAAIGAPVPCR